MENRKEDHEFGESRDKTEKCVGCLLSLALITVIIFPILIFSTFNPAVELNNITGGNIFIDLIVKNELREH